MAKKLWHNVRKHKMWQKKKCICSHKDKTIVVGCGKYFQLFIQGLFHAPRIVWDCAFSKCWFNLVRTIYPLSTLLFWWSFGVCVQETNLILLQRWPGKKSRAFWGRWNSYWKGLPNRAPWNLLWGSFCCLILDLKIILLLSFLICIKQKLGCIKQRVVINEQREWIVCMILKEISNVWLRLKGSGGSLSKNSNDAN